MIWMKHKHQKYALNAVNAEMHSSMNSYLWYKSMFKERLPYKTSFQQVFENEPLSQLNWWIVDLGATTLEVPLDVKNDQGIRSSRVCCIRRSLATEKYMWKVSYKKLYTPKFLGDGKGLIFSVKRKSFAGDDGSV